MVEQQPEGSDAGIQTLAQPPREASTNATANRPIEEQWDDGATMDEATVAGEAPGTGEGFGSPDEMTIEEPAKPSAPAKLVVIAGNDTGREFVLAPGKVRSIGRAIENDVVLTDIAVSRKHLDVVFEGGGWMLKDRGSGNGTLINDRIEDGAYRLQHGDRIEIGHTVFRFDHPGAPGAVPDLGWVSQNDDEASTVAGRAPPRPAAKSSPPPIAAGPPRRPGTASSPPPLPPGAGDRAKVALPPPRPHTPSGALSARLALPANPGTGIGVNVDETPPPPAGPGGKVEPSFLIAPSSFATGSDALAMRSMTATAHVEPLGYTGSMPPMQAYVHIPPPTSRRKQIAIAAAVSAGIVMIGVIAMLTGGDAPAGKPTDEPAVKVSAGSGTDDPVRVASADGGDAALAPDPVEENAPEPKVDEPTVEPDPVPDKVEPDPVPDKVEPKVLPPPDRHKVDKPKVDKVVKVDKPRVDKPRVDKPRVDKPKVPKVDKAVAGGSGAKKKAQSLYASKDFKGAATAAREGAASAADADEAAALRKLASDYDSLASSLAAGNAAAGSKPTEALTAYKKALSADKRLGGTHASMIREKLAQVAPKAAAGFMAKGNYEAAKQAADTAVNFGAGSSATVTQVRQSLERKAGEFFTSGQKLLASKPDEAKALFRRVQKIVPTDSPWYAKAYKALNTRTQTKDDDE